MRGNTGLPVPLKFVVTALKMVTGKTYNSTIALSLSQETCVCCGTWSGSHTHTETITMEVKLFDNVWLDAKVVGLSLPESHIFHSCSICCSIYDGKECQHFKNVKTWPTKLIFVRQSPNKGYQCRKTSMVSNNLKGDNMYETLLAKLSPWEGALRSWRFQQYTLLIVISSEVE